MKNRQAGYFMSIPFAWFTPSSLVRTDQPVSRWHYFIVGLALALAKYAVEAVTLWLTTAKTYSPIDFLSPFLGNREQYLAGGPEWLGLAWVVWTLPFVAICVLMTIRRCEDAGVSPWLSFLTLIPLVNLAALVFFAILPTQSTDQTADESTETLPPLNAFAPVEAIEGDPLPCKKSNGWQAAGAGLLAGVLYLLFTVVVSVFVIGSYGAALFFGAPILTAATAAYWLNRGQEVTLLATIGHTTMVFGFSSLGFLLLGIEGGICIIMALPIFLPLGFLGAVVGRSIARTSPYNEQRTTELIGCLAILPVIAAIENSLQRSPILKVESSVTIHAPIERVWNEVIAFPEIEEPPSGIFAWGVAYPQRAKMFGAGIGAIRHCEFSTGVFIEPITAWEEPTLLAFDVTSQPDPMTELSPYHSLHPPHLSKSFRSLRGEFRLSEISNGRTELNGTTWYELELGPRSYWKLWTDHLIHRIHFRVLDHIRRGCEE